MDARCHRFNMVGLLTWVFQFNSASQFILALLFSSGVCYLICCAMRLEKNKSRAVMGLLLLFCFSVFYFIAGMQTGATITVFLSDQIAQGHIHMALPASAFNTLYAGFILVLAVVFSTCWKVVDRWGVDVNIYVKVLLSLLLAMLSMALFALATVLHHALLFTVMLAYLLLSAGELILTPAVYAAISDRAPQAIKSTLMGGWFLFIGIGGFLSGTVAHWARGFGFGGHGHYSVYTGAFLFIAGLMLAALVGAYWVFKRFERSTALEAKQVRG